MSGQKTYSKQLNLWPFIVMLPVFYFVGCQSESNSDNNSNNNIETDIPIRESSNNSNDMMLPMQDITDMAIVTDMSMTTPAQTQLSMVLPEMNCLIWDDQQGCLLNKPETATESCTQYRSALESSPPIQEVGSIQACQSSLPYPLDLQSAETFLNYVRSRLGQPDVSLSSDSDHADCALVSHISDSEGSWNSRSDCYSDELSEFSDFNASKAYGSWSIHSFMDQIISSSRSDSSNFRSILLSSYLHNIDVGLNGGVSCMNFDLVNNLSTPLNFSFYPGVGYIPLEFVSPGNHEGKSAPWSIKIDEQDARIEDISLFLITNNGETSVSIEDLTSPQADPNIMVWQLTTPPQGGQVYKVNLKWKNEDTDEDRNVDLYLTFNDCGYQMPTNCNPNRNDQCSVPGKKCMYYRFQNEEGDWFCLSEGPRQEGEDCSDYPPACRGEMVCINSDEGQQCRSFCSLDESSNLACANTCDDYSITEVATQRIGICNE